MTKTGPQKYPGASTKYWYQDNYPGDSMESNVIVWHSTEGTSIPTYNGGSIAPNFTAMPDFTNKRLVWYQHFDFDVSSRALENHSGGVETNTLNAAQIEVVGTCDPSTHKKWGTARPHLYMADLPDWVIRDMAEFAAWAHTHHGVILESGLTFKPYDSSYGTRNGVRLSGAKWLNFYGHCGHMHVPENVHGDPGAFPMSAILSVAKKLGSGSTSSSSHPAKPKYEPFPGASFFVKNGRPALGKSSAIFTAMGKRLVAEGCSHYKVGPGPRLGQADVDSYEAWQRKCGFSGSDAKWPPGKTTWDKLKIPNV